MAQTTPTPRLPTRAAPAFKTPRNPVVVTNEAVENIQGNHYLIRGQLLPGLGARGHQVGDIVAVEWKDGQMYRVRDWTVRRGISRTGRRVQNGIVEELFIADRGSPFGKDVFFRNDQMVQPLDLEAYVQSDPANLRIEWGLDDNSFYIADGDMDTPGVNFKVHVFTLDREDPQKAFGSTPPTPTFVKTWTAGGLSLHLSQINFDGQLYGAYEQTGSGTAAKLVLMDWNDSLEIEFNDMLGKDLLAFKSIVLDEALDVIVLFSADVESRRIDFEAIYPRHDGTHFVDSTETPTQPNADGGVYDYTDSFFDGPPSSFTLRVLREANWSFDGDMPEWAVDPGVHFFLCNVTTPAVQWRTMKAPFNFVWRKSWVCSPKVDNPTALANRRNTGRIFYGINDWNAFLPSQGFITTSIVGDLDVGVGPGLVHGKPIKGGATMRDPVDTGLVSFADPENENKATFTGVPEGGPPALPINEQGSTQTIILGGVAFTFTFQVTWTRTLQRLWRSHKWVFDTQEPVYYGRRSGNYAAPASKGIIALVGERHPGANGFVYVPVTVLGGNPTLVETSVPSTPPDPLFWPYQASTLDDITGSEDFTADQVAYIRSIDVKTGGAFALEATFTRPDAQPLSVLFQVGNEFHIAWSKTFEGAQSVKIAQLRALIGVTQVSANIADYLSRGLVIIRPDQLWQGLEDDQVWRFIDAWSTANGVTLAVQPNVDLDEDPALIGRGVLLASDFTPLTTPSYIAIDLDDLETALTPEAT